MTRHLVLSLLVLSLAAACRQQPESVPEPAQPVAPPWSSAALAASAVPSVYHTEWSKAENRDRCALLAPAMLDAPEQGAIPRAATFSGGWAVAYDMPGLRSAFGVAGSGGSADDNVYDGWPNRRTYADGSRVNYGLEGGTGPNWLAYVRIPGQHCLYNVWSRRGQTHLESLLDQLRFVAPR